MRITIKDLKTDEIPEVMEFWKQSGFRIPPSQQSLTRFLAQGYGKILRADGRIMAATLYSICGPNEANLEFFAVEKDRRRKGLGRKLYNACRSDLFRQGVRRIILLVNTRNETAHAFWTAVGIRPIRGARAYFGRIRLT